MMDLAEITWPSFNTSTDAPKFSAMVTKRAAARACNPRLLQIVTTRDRTGSPEAGESVIQFYRWYRIRPIR
jgi:hypothetical protein